MIHSHRLTSKNKRHKSFLEEERKDPITGDKLIEGNEIVLCGACKSAFLLDSWNYMARSHCNQPFTLKEIPTKQHVEKEVEQNIDKSHKFKLRNSNQLLQFLLGIISLVFVIPTLLIFFYKPSFSVQSLFFLCLSLFISSSFFYLFFTDRPYIKITSSKLLIVSLLNTRILYLSKIEKLEFFYSSIDNEYDKNILIIMFLMNGKIKKVNIEKGKYTTSKIKELQEYFEENNLSDKISVFIDNLT